MQWAAPWKIGRRCHPKQNNMSPSREGRVHNEQVALLDSSSSLKQRMIIANHFKC